ncbi:MAG TPA: glycosyltransferase, partial [Pyrinomonadaceae bacterium]
LVKRTKRNSSVDVNVVGYTTEMDEYMSASDLILGKPGGLTTSEALAKGLVLVIVNPIPGQEERNSDHLLEEGVAIRCNNLPALAFKIDQLLDDTKRLEQMRRNVKRLARPNAASEIVRQLLERN